jgi:hypothetical protein
MVVSLSRFNIIQAAEKVPHHVYELGCLAARGQEVVWPPCHIWVAQVESGADYVETAPRPGVPSPPGIPSGECPLNFLQADIQHAKQAACSFGKSGLQELRQRFIFILWTL